jgi:DegV family protein with EDD domain
MITKMDCGEIGMGNIKIITDSTCDLTMEVFKSKDISFVPLYVSFNEIMYRDLVEISTMEVFKMVKEYDKLPKTSAPSPADFSNAFKPYINNGQDIIYIGLSSMLSSTINSATIAASEFEAGRIEIIDSRNLSSGIGLLVLKAIDYVNAGMGLKEVAEGVRKLVPKVRTAFAIDTLEYLYKGGRCSALQNFASGVFKIKPIISVVEGKMIVREKVRGKEKKVLDVLINSVLDNKDNIDLSRIIITHSMSKDNADFIKSELEAKIKFEEILITDAGCVISSHCGPNTIGILYIEK